MLEQSDSLLLDGDSSLHGTRLLVLWCLIDFMLIHLALHVQTIFLHDHKYGPLASRRDTGDHRLFKIKHHYVFVTEH